MDFNFHKNMDGKMTNWHIATGRLWKFGIISIIIIAFFHMALDSAVTKLRWDMQQGLAAVRVQVVALQEQVSKPVDLSGYVKRDELMKSVFKGR